MLLGAFTLGNLAYGNFAADQKAFDDAMARVEQNCNQMADSVDISTESGSATARWNDKVNLPGTGRGDLVKDNELVLQFGREPSQGSSFSQNFRRIRPCSVDCVWLRRFACTQDGPSDSPLVSDFNRYFDILYFDFGF